MKLKNSPLRVSVQGIWSLRDRVQRFNITTLKCKSVNLNLKKSDYSKWNNYMCRIEKITFDSRDKKTPACIRCWEKSYIVSICGKDCQHTCTNLSRVPDCGHIVGGIEEGRIQVTDDCNGHYGISSLYRQACIQTGSNNQL